MQSVIDRIAKDEELRDAVLREIDWRPDIHSQDINVKASGSAVVLTGFVHTYAEKANAEKAAKSVRGVVSIANDIEVRPSNRTDPEIARDVQHVLKSHVMVPPGAVIATVHEGFVTLEGIVEWHYQKTSAIEATEAVRGVRGVISLVSVKPRISAAAVKDAIESALRRNASVDAGKIQVSTSNSTVELKGKVHSFFEREAAERAAWGAPGVQVVKNNIQIAY